MKIGLMIVLTLVALVMTGILVWLTIDSIRHRRWLPDLPIAAMFLYMVGRPLVACILFWLKML